MLIICNYIESLMRIPLDSLNKFIDDVTDDEFWIVF